MQRNIEHMQYDGTASSGEAIKKWAADYDIFFFSLSSPYHQSLVIRKNSKVPSPDHISPHDYAVRIPTGELILMQPSEFDEYTRLMSSRPLKSRNINRMPGAIYSHLMSLSSKKPQSLDALPEKLLGDDWFDLSEEARRTVLDRFCALCSMHYIAAEVGDAVIMPFDMRHETDIRRYVKTQKS